MVAKCQLKLCHAGAKHDRKSLGQTESCELMSAAKMASGCFLTKKPFKLMQHTSCALLLWQLLYWIIFIHPVFGLPSSGNWVRPTRGVDHFVPVMVKPI